MKNYNESLELLETMWVDANFELVGIDGAIRECIDRDQAVDDDGKAVFKSYEFVTVDQDGEMKITKFSADEIENFARTW